MNLPGPCAECGSPLDGEERYCINCGHRVAPPLALPYVPAVPSEAAAAGARAEAAGAPATATGAAHGPLSWLPMPVQALTTFAALALGFGVVVGTALSPSLQNLLAAPQEVAQAPPPAEPAPAAPGGGGGGGAPARDVASADVFGTTGTGSGGGGGGGGGGKKPKKKPKPEFISGTVVHVNPVARSYTIAVQGGLTSIHTVTPPAVGTNVRVPIVQLANRTYGEDGKRQLKGSATQATFAGVVTDRRDSTDPGTPDTYTVSAHGASILVHSPPDPTALLGPPAIGMLATTTVEIRNTAPTPMPTSGPGSPTCTPPPAPLPDPPLAFPTELHQASPGSLIVDPASSIKATEIETVVQKLCPGAPGELLLASDDVREGKADSALLNGGLDLARISAGTPTIVSVSVVDDPTGPPGSKKLGSATGITSDQGQGGADDLSGAQGDLRAASTAAARARATSERRIARAFARAERVRAKRKASRD